ncbi:MAG TPA: hypothetical protein VLD55_12520, partial [Candidatus Sulfobium mesophilum]|nr:hypothetical protein [Candidatus Sulfobium mesophilum]
VLRPDLDDFLFFSSETIKVSRIFEEGKINKAQFEEKQRQLTAILEREETRRDQKLSLTRMTIYDEDSERFYFYRESLFLGYMTTLQQQLDAGPQFSRSHCDFFGDNIQFTEQKPPF